MRFRRLSVLLLLPIVLFSCTGTGGVSLDTPQSTITPAQETLPTLTNTGPVLVTVATTQSPTANDWMATPTETFTPPPTSTSIPISDPYEPYTIDHLLVREYGGGELQIIDTLAANSYFARTLFTYPSDGLAIYGFMNVPKRSAPHFPVVIALHGYIDPDIYQTIDYTTRYADALARSGFLVLHPNLRNYPPSGTGDDLFRVGMAVDVLNLIALVKDQAGKPGPLALGDPQAIGLWGHSMGGGISTRVMTVSPDVEAVVLYGAMSGDEKRNFERINGYFSDGERGWEELLAPDEAFQHISPIYYLDRIQAAVSIHHGEDDQEVPLSWSVDLCGRLRDLKKQVECYTYPNQPHTFKADGDELFIQRTIEFLDQRLKGR
jgi:uncharacterized protein